MYRRSQFSQICGIPVQGKRLNWNDFYKETEASRSVTRKYQKNKRLFEQAYDERENRRFLWSIYPKPEMPRFCPCEHKKVIRSPQGTEFGIEQLLGSGGFGKAYEGCWIDENRKIAIKVMKFSTEKQIELARDEALNIMNIKKLFPKSKYFPMFYNIFVIGEKIYFIMEKLDVDLGRFVANSKSTGIDLKFVRIIGKQILEGLIFLHNFGFVHSDMKLENILFANPSESGKDVWQVKIIDFGLMKTIDEVMNLRGSTFGTFTYWSPEMYLGLPMNEKIDLWSVGIIFLELFLRRSLFGVGCKPVAILAHFIKMVGLPENATDGTEFTNIFCENEDSGKLAFINEQDVGDVSCSYNYVGFEAVHKIPYLDIGVPSNQIPKTVDDILFKKLLTALMNPNAADRIGAEQARQHRFFDLA